LREIPKVEGRTEPEIGRANLPVSRIIILAIIDRKIALFAGVYKKWLTGRFALPNRKNKYFGS
jgi:hypothetical protein